MQKGWNFEKNTEYVSSFNYSLFFKNIRISRKIKVCLRYRCEGEYPAVEFIIFKVNFQLRFEYVKSWWCDWIKNQLTPKALRGGFPPWGLWLITSEVENFSIRNFVTFPYIKCRELGQTDWKFLKFATWVMWHDHLWWVCMVKRAHIWEKCP